MRSLFRLIAAVGLLLVGSSPAWAQRQSLELSSTTCPGSGCVTLGVTNLGSASVQLVGSGTWTAVVEGSIDGSNFETLSMNPAGGGVAVTSVTASGLWIANVGGLTQIRVRLSAYTDGAVVATIQAAPSGGGAGGGGGTASNVSITQGGNTAEVNASSQLSIVCANCSGSGVAVLEDAAAADADPGTPAYAVRKATPANTSGTDGDYEALQMSAGRLWVSGLVTGGGIAHDAAGTGAAPVLFGGYASAAAPTDVSADGDAVRSWFLRSGAQVTQPTFGGVLASAGNGVSGTGVQRVTIASDSTGVIGATQSGTWNVTNVSGTVSLPTGASTAAKQDTGNTSLASIDTSASRLLSSAGPKAAGSALATTAFQVGGTYNATPPTMTDTQEGGLQLDENGQLKVATTAVTQSGTWNARLQDGSGNALTSLSVGAQRAITVSVVDGSGNQITAFSGSGGTASNYGSAFPSAGTASGFTDGTNMQGARVVDSDTGAGSYYTLATNAVFRTSGTPVEAGTSSNPWNVVFPSAQAVTQSGTWNVGTVTSVTTLGTITNALPAGTNVIGHVIADSGSTTAVTQATASNLNATVVGTGTFAVQATLAAGATSIGKAEDDASANADVGVPAFAVRKATPANTSGADGDYEALQISAGRLWTSATIDAALPAGTNAIGKLASNTGVTIGAVELAASQTLATVTTVGTVSTVTSLSQLGGVALPIEDAAETAAGVGIYAMSVRRDTAASSAGTTGDNATLNTDSLGRLWTTGSAVEDAAETAAGILNMAGTVRRDTAASSAGTTGDNATLNTDAVGALWVNPFSQTQAAATYLTVRLSDGSSFLTPGTDYTHDAALTTSTTAGPVLMGRGKDAAPTNVSADDDAVLAWFLRNGSQVTNIAAGSTLITATSTSLNVNCTGGCSGGTQYTHDAALTVGSSVVTLAGGRASAAVPTDVSADGDAVIPWYLRSGAQAVQPTYGGVLASAGNGASGTGTLRVTIANDSTGIVALTTSTASIGKLAANSGVDIGDVDVTSAVITGGGVAHDGAASGVNPILIGAYASQAAPTDVSADGDSVRLWALRNGSQVVNLAAGGTLITSTGANLNVQCANCSGSGASGVDDAAFTIATDSVAPAGFLFDDVAPDSVNEGDVGLGRMSANRNQYVTLRDAAGNERGLNIDASNKIGVTADLTLVGGNAINVNSGSASTGTLRTVEANDSPVASVLGTTGDGAATAGATGSASAKLRLMTTQLDAIQTSVQLADDTVFAEDAAHTSTDKGQFVLGRRIDVPAASSGASGDYEAFNMNATGALWVSNIDPCSSEAKITAPFSLTARGVIIAAAASKKNYICSISVVAGAAEIFNIVEGTGTTCQTSTAAIVGSTTAANGLSFAANGGMAAVGGGATVIAGTGTNVDTCIMPSSTNRLSGFVTYVQR